MAGLVKLEAAPPSAGAAHDQSQWRQPDRLDQAVPVTQTLTVTK